MVDSYMNLQWKKFAAIAVSIFLIFTSVSWPFQLAVLFSLYVIYPVIIYTHSDGN